VALASDLVGISNAVGAPSFALFAKGGNLECLRLTGVRITYPDGSTVGLGYDYRGRRTSVTDQNNKTTTYTYDDVDRLPMTTWGG
jgi:YD repeat-containing protein